MGTVVHKQSQINYNELERQFRSISSNSLAEFVSKLILIYLDFVCEPGPDPTRGYVAVSISKTARIDQQGVRPHVPWTPHFAGGIIPVRHAARNLVLDNWSGAGKHELPPLPALMYTCQFGFHPSQIYLSTADPIHNMAVVCSQCPIDQWFPNWGPWPPRGAWGYCRGAMGAY